MDVANASFSSLQGSAAASAAASAAEAPPAQHAARPALGLGELQSLPHSSPPLDISSGPEMGEVSMLVEGVLRGGGGGGLGAFAQRQQPQQQQPLSPIDLAGSSLGAWRGGGAPQ